MSLDLIVNLAVCLIVAAVALWEARDLESPEPALAGAASPEEPALVPLENSVLEAVHCTGCGAFVAAGELAEHACDTSSGARSMQ